MGIRDWFAEYSKDESIGSKVLVCSLADGFDELVQADAEIYTHYYPDTTKKTLQGIPELMKNAGEGYDIIHLFCFVSSAGVITDIRGNRITGNELIQKCCDSNVKLLWIASDNVADGYIKGFNAKGKRLNLVMTINRNGAKFFGFLQQLLSRMFYGDTMPVAWNDISPQIPGTSHPDSPDAIFYAGRGAVKLR